MKILTLLLCTLASATSAFAVDARSVIPAAPFSAESHPDDWSTIRPEGGVIGYIKSNTWVRYDNLSFGSEPVVQIRIKASAPNGGGSIKVRNGSLTGPVIATVAIPSTGDWGNYRNFMAGIDSSFTPSGSQNSIVFEFVGGGGDLMNVAEFSFATMTRSWKSDVLASEFLQESAPSNPAIIDRSGNNLINITDDSWVDYGLFGFDPGMTYAWIEASASTNSPQGIERKIEFRTGSKDGPIIGSVEVPNTSGAYKPLGVKFSAAVTGVTRLYLTFQGGTGNLFDLSKFRFQTLAPDYKPSGLTTARIERDFSTFTQAGSFTSESNPNDDGNVRSENGYITYISGGQWVGYASYNFGAGANYVTLQGTSPGAGGTVELRLNNPTSGTLLGTVAISGTGGWDNYQPFNADLTQTVTGVQNIFFRFVGNGWGIYNLKDFRFQQVEAGLKARGRLLAAQQFDLKSTSGVNAISGSDGITSVSNGTWVAYNGFNFGQGADLITVTAATPNKGGTAEVRLNSSSGPLVAIIDVTHTGSLTNYREYTAALSQTISGTHDLYLKFVDTFTQSGNLFNLKNLIVEKKAPVTSAPTNEGALTVYDSVTGLAPSPYYTYSIQKVSDLNALLKQNATNWLSPFAWFTECKVSGEPYTTAYYMQEIAGWSHTYCNFEMGKNTPIVVKISRKSSNPYGAPSGPIFMANVHPAHKVQSCEIINGEVYVTMREPALVTVDIDGQMDARDAPRSSPAELASSKPYASREKGSHAVSIFANPVISGKPAAAPTNLPTSGPILYIEPGGNAKTKINSRDDWTTVYFLPGVHSFSGFESNGQPKKIEPGDQCPVKSGRNYYISGDAMIYGCFKASDVSNTRFFGLGTLSGRFIPHYQDSSWTDPKYSGQELPGGLMIGIDNMTNSHFEGVTVTDASNHALNTLFGWGNSRRWWKQIGWRANTDMGNLPGPTEDCFFRLQDDGPYVGNNDFRRNTLWFDCNGSPFRGSFLLRGTYAPGEQTVVEDCDIIYARANWGGEVISTGDHWESGTYPDGTRNSGQHLIFRNLRVTDPRPTRGLFSFSSPANFDVGFAGIRFENIEYRHPHSWGRGNAFWGSAIAPFHHLYFDRVFIEGKKMDAALLADPSVFGTSYISDFVFRDAPANPPPAVQVTVDTTGVTTVLNYDNPQNTYNGNGTLQISNDGSGVISLGTEGSKIPSVFAMTGGLITIDSGVSLVNGGWQKGIWTNNKSSMQVNGILNLWDGNPVFVDALNGSGKVAFADQWSTAPRILNVGVNGGSGTFSGEIQAQGSMSYIQLVKWGSGTQKLNNLAIQMPKEITINQGSVNLAGNNAVTMASNISGKGNLIKSGMGILTLSGTVLNTGEITVSQGTLKVPNGLNTQSKLTLATGAKVDLGGSNKVASLSLGGSGPLPAGTYNSSHSTYGSYFAGTTRIEVTNIPLPWDTVAIGHLNSSVSFSNGTFTQSGSGMGAAMSVTSDSVRFTYQKLVGNGYIVAKINNVQNTGGSARVGVMIRSESSAGNSMHAFIGVNGTPGYRWAYRATTNALNTSITITGTLNPANIWVKLVRNNNTITAFTSSDGVNWISNPPNAPWANVFTNLPSTCYFGLAVSAGFNDTTLNTSQFSNVSVISTP